MLRLFRTSTSLLLLSFALVCEAGAQPTSTQLNLGTLRCTIASGVAVIVDSPKDMSCIFYKPDGTQEAYRGQVRGGGLNLGITGRTFAAWAVTGDAGILSAMSLSGRYSGVEAGVTVGVGATSRSLSNPSKAVSLQPLNVGPQSGLNIALGISQMDLLALGAPQLATTVEPAPLVPDRTYPAPAPQPEPAPTLPRVPDYDCSPETRLQPSQTLSGLTRACRVSLNALLEENPQIRNVRSIQAGALIRVPQQPGSRAGRCGTRTLVTKGETLADVASRCRVRVDALSLANPDLTSDRPIPAGQVLAIPEPADAREPIETAAAPAPKQSTEPQPEPPVTAPVNENAEQTDAQPSAEAVTALLPGLEQQDALETAQLEQQEADSDFAPIEERCRQVASKQYGLPEDQITTSSTSEADDNKSAIVLNVGSTEITCLVDQQGEVISVTESQPPPELADVDDASYQIIKSRLPDDEALTMIAISDEAELRQTGRIEGYRSTSYGFQARASETLVIVFEPDNIYAYFNVVSADMPYGKALFVGIQESRNRAVIRIPEDGMYLVRPYLALAAARQNQTANYTLHISRTTPLSAPPQGKADRKNFAPSGKSDPLMPLN